MNEDSSTVHLVDDNLSFLTATSRLLRASGFTVKTFSSAQEFLAQLAHGAHGCVVVDLRMPGLGGLDLQAAMARTKYAMPVIFLTAKGDVPSTVHAMKSGAVDFLEKRTPKQKLLLAVRHALDRATAEREEKCRSEESKARFDVLTAREREVLGHVVQGKLNKQIASTLGISESTVKIHRVAITTKLGVPSVAELTRIVLESGFFEERAALY